MKLQLTIQEIECLVYKFAYKKIAIEPVAGSQNQIAVKLSFLPLFMKNWKVRVDASSKGSIYVAFDATLLKLGYKILDFFSKVPKGLLKPVENGRYLVSLRKVCELAGIAGYLSVNNIDILDNIVVLEASLKK